MFMPTTDYNQQLLAYLQTWRQLLEQWSGMAGMPFPSAPSAMPSMPPMPPTAPASPMPPAPGDYTQQLFGYLQAWRQYLEQAAGAGPGTAQPPTSQPASYPEHRPVHSAPPKVVPIPPDDPGGTKFYPEAAAPEKSDPWPPPLLYKAPETEGGSQVPHDFLASPASLYNRGPDAPERLRAPEYDFGNQLDRFPGRAESSLRQEAAARAEAPAERPQSAPKSLYSISRARAASTIRQETGQAIKRRAVATDARGIELIAPIAGRKGSG